jgi:glucosamine 6-phosphate synthetase-like amidotransferase/phosphosugar isomerase protein
MENAITRCRTPCKEIAQFLLDKKHQKMFILGKGSAHAIALEGALKIKEIA